MGEVIQLFKDRENKQPKQLTEAQYLRRARMLATLKQQRLEREVSQEAILEYLRNNPLTSVKDARRAIVRKARLLKGK